MVRGVAAILVVWLHVSEMFRSFLPLNTTSIWVYHVAETVDFGRIGVVAFFAVSGFVIPASFNQLGWLGLKIFIVRRFFRLFPAFWLSIPLAFWSSWYLWDKPVSLVQVLANMTMLPSLFEELPLEGLYWTLELEMLFYLLCMMLFWWGKVHDTKILALTSALLLVGFLLNKTCSLASFMSEDGGLRLLFLAIMFWGAVYRKWYDGHFDGAGCWRWVLWGVPVIIVLLMPLVFLSLMLLNGQVSPDSIKFFTSYALGLALFILLASLRTLRFTPFSKLGEISYSVYLFHPVVFYPVYWWAGRTRLEWVRDLPLEVWVLSMIAASVAVAYVVFRWVEKPAIEYSRMISSRMLRSST